MGSLFQNTHSIILFHWFHVGLNPDKFLLMGYLRSYQFFIPLTLLELYNNQWIYREFHLIDIYLQTTFSQHILVIALVVYFV